MPGYDELLARCGGYRSYATCRVFIDAAFAAMLPPMGADEDEPLDSSAVRGARSRLSCQLRFADGWDGLRGTIAPEEMT